MKHFGKAVVSSRFVILIAAVLLLIPSIIGIRGTRINYDMLVYLPDTIETMQGQDILVNEFGTGAISMLIVEGKEDKEIVRLKEQVEAVDHVKDVIWYDSFADISIPKELLPQKLLDVFVRGDATLLAVTYDTSTSADETMEAVTAIRELLDDHSFLQGTNAAVTDTKILCEEEEPVYVGLAVLLALIITGLAMDTFAAPVLFLLSIGCAILYNMGTNVFLGEISYVTKAVAAVLQLGVTMDYSIFLWHSFEENMEHTADCKEAMASAIQATLQSVVGSSITTIAGFAALCFMSFTFGLDVGVVMMKGVAFGVISCVTILPSMILVFLPLVLKTRHRPLVPKLAFLPGWVAKHYKAVLVLFVLIWIPAVIGYFRTDVYYDLDKSLPTSLPSVEARAKLQDTFDMSNTMMILADADLSPKAASDLCEELRDVDGVKGVMGIDAFLGAGIPRDMLPEELSGKLQAGGWQLLLLTSCYQAATDEMDARSEGHADRRRRLHQGPDRNLGPRFQRRQLGLHRHDLRDHPRGIPVSQPALPAGADDRICHFHQYGGPVLYRDAAALRRLDHHRDRAAGLDRRLRDPDDRPLPDRAGRRKGPGRGGAHRAQHVDSQHPGQRTDLFRGHLRGGDLFEHRYRFFPVHADGPRGPDQHGSGDHGAAGASDAL